MPAPPARMRSASVPCGQNSTSSSPARNWRSNSAFSPTYDETILRICRVCSSRPRPQSSTPALLETQVRFFTPRLTSALMRFSGMPQRPKPPTTSVAPSNTSRTASSADATTLLIMGGKISKARRLHVIFSMSDFSGYYARDGGWSGGGRRGDYVRDFSGLGPRNGPSDARLFEEVCERLTDDELVDAGDIEVHVSGAEVTLTGRVGSRREKRRAGDIAWSVRGVRDVMNALRLSERDRE